MKVGVKFDKIVESCSKFFSHDEIIVARKTLYEEIVPDERCIKYVNDEGSVMDIGKLLCKYSKEK